MPLAVEAALAVLDYWKAHGNELLMNIAQRAAQIEPAVRKLAHDVPVGVHPVVELNDAFAEELATVSDELDGRVDLVGDPGGKPPDRLELLSLAELDLHLRTVCDLGAELASGLFGRNRRDLAATA